jgi:hypothetical protein
VRDRDIIESKKGQCLGFIKQVSGNDWRESHEKSGK